MDSGNIIGAVIGAAIGSLGTLGIEYWRLKVTRSTRKAETEKAAQEAFWNWQTSLELFFTKYDLREPTTDFRIMFLRLAELKLEVTNLKQRNIKITRLAEEIKNTKLVQTYAGMLVGFDKLENILQSGTYNGSDIADSLNIIRVGLKSSQEITSNIRIE
jgi:hypothetical protein